MADGYSRCTALLPLALAAMASVSIAQEDLIEPYLGHWSILRDSSSIVVECGFACDLVFYKDELELNFEDVCAYEGAQKNGNGGLDIELACYYHVGDASADHFTITVGEVASDRLAIQKDGSTAHYERMEAVGAATVAGNLPFVGDWCNAKAKVEISSLYITTESAFCEYSVVLGPDFFGDVAKPTYSLGLGCRPYGWADRDSGFESPIKMGAGLTMESPNRISVSFSRINPDVGLSSNNEFTRCD